MMRILAIINIICLLALPLSGFSATEDLDEMDARKARYATNTYGPNYLEDATTYVWQPETVIYNDKITGNEVVVLFHGPDQEILWSKEFATEAWSFDGSTMGAFISSTERPSNNPLFTSSSATPRWLVKTDGSQLKVAGGYANNGISEGGFGWAHTENAYYGIGVHSSWDAAPGMLVKNVVSTSNVVTASELIQLNDANTAKGYAVTTFGIVKNPISPDDNWITISSREEIDRGTTLDCLGQMRVALNKGVSPTVEDYWGINRDMTEYYDHLAASERGLHSGENRAWGFDNEYNHFLYESPAHVFFQLESSGSAADGGPVWEDWDGDSYGDNEVSVLTYGDDSRTGPAVPAGGYRHPYWNHVSVDKWMKYVLTGLGDTTGASSELIGPGIAIRDIMAGTEYIEIAKDLTTNPLNQYDGNHKSWTGWTDEVIMFPAYIDGVASEQETMYARRINFDNATKEDARAIVTTHLNSESNYNSLPRPSQSPDGTKVAFSTYFLNNNVTDPYIAYVVSENPYPPEITQLTGTGTYTIRFDYRLDQTTARGYSNRGWPTSTDDKPVPRELKKFRLWRSDDGSTWEPISTTNASITTKFDLSNGGLNSGQVGYWEMTDTPGAGTFYYAVTAIENSGLESQVVSNVYSTTGSQTAAYPSNPGGGSGVVAAYDSDIARYYNIYAEDGSTPTVSQTNRIASIPLAHGASFVDWLGKTDGTTEYVVTAVDTQGNESTALTSSSTHKQSPATADGQYSLSWQSQSAARANFNQTGTANFNQTGSVLFNR